MINLYINGEGKDLHIEQRLNSAPAVNPDDMLWIANSMLNFATLTVVPYSNKGYAYVYVIADFNNFEREERGMFVDDVCIDMILNRILNGKSIDLAYFDEPHEATKTDNFPQQVFERLVDSKVKFVKKHRSNVSGGNDEPEIIRGIFTLFRGIVKISIPKTTELEKILTKNGSSRIDFFKRPN